MTDDAPPEPAQLDVALHTRRRRTGYPFAGFLPVLQWGLREHLRPKKLIPRLAIALALGALAALLVTGTPSVGGTRDPVLRLWEVLDLQILQLLLPLVALLIVGPGYSRELRQRTLVYYLVRPVSRTTVFLARYVSGVLPAALIALALFWPTLLLSGVAVPWEVWAGTAAIALIGVGVLGAVYYVLSALFRRGLVAGLIYTFVIEGLVGNLPGAIQKLSVRFHLRGLHHGLMDDAFVERSDAVARAIRKAGEFGGNPFTQVNFGLTEADPPGVALGVLLAIAGVLLAFGVYLVRTRDFALKD